MKAIHEVVRVGDKYQIEKTEDGVRYVMYRGGVVVKAQFSGDLELAVASFNAGNAPYHVTWVSLHSNLAGQPGRNLYMVKTAATVHAKSHRIGAFNAL